jgi:hypothetical protein
MSSAVALLVRAGVATLGWEPRAGADVLVWARAVVPVVDSMGGHSMHGNTSVSVPAA